MPQPVEYLEHLYRAVASPIGGVVECEEGGRDNCRQQLYSARRKAADSALDILQIRFSPVDPNQLWIVKGKATDASE